MEDLLTMLSYNNNLYSLETKLVSIIRPKGLCDRARSIKTSPGRL